MCNLFNQKKKKYEPNNEHTLRFLSIFAIMSLRVVKLGLSSGFAFQQSVMTP